MARQRTAPYGLRFLAGRLCLDFINSVENRAGQHPEDFLTSYEELVNWGLHRNLLTESEAGRLTRLAAEHPGQAAAALATALEFREALHRVFLALATERDPVTGDLTHVQRIYGQAVAHAHLRSVEGRFDWDWRARENGLNLEYLLWPIAFSAVELLTGGERNRVKVCANPDGCGWLFYDGSKNGSRRWCSMEGCGSQVKMRRQYAKRVGRVMRDA